MNLKDVPRTIKFKDYLVEMKESGSALKWIWQELIGEDGKKMAIRFVWILVAASLLASLQPLIFSRIVNTIHSAKTSGLIYSVVALVISAFLYHGVYLVQGLVREYAWNRTMNSLQVRIDKLFHEKSLGQHLEEGSSLNYTTIDRAKGRIENIQQLLLFDTGAMLIQVVFSYSLLWFLSWQVGIVATFMLGVHIIWSLYLNYHVSVGTDDIERQMRRHGRQLIERWEKISRVKTSGKSASEHNRLADWYTDILHADKVFWFWFIKQTVVRDAFALVLRLGVICYGVYLVYHGTWQVGLLIPLYAWITDLSQNMRWIGFTERRINQQVPYIKAMRDALMITPAFSDTAGITFAHVDPVKVEFRNVTLAYTEGGDRQYPILRDVSFTIHPGDKVALLGPSGAGKTSLMKLLLRFMDPTTGQIRVNGNSLDELNLSSWMERVGYIPQQPQVFDGTIRYNLTFGLSEERQKTITDEEIWDVMRLLQIDFGERLTDGLETRVGKDGMKLSGGQAQRLMIGAAVIMQPIFMIVDEATSSLDSSTERLVQEGLEKVLTGNVGALIVAHRLSTVRKICNRFIVLRPLEEIPCGESQVEAVADSFEELYMISPTFRRLADDQHVNITPALRH